MLLYVIQFLIRASYYGIAELLLLYMRWFVLSIGIIIYHEYATSGPPSQGKRLQVNPVMEVEQMNLLSILWGGS